MPDHRQSVNVSFTVEAVWTENGLIIECPSVAAQYFVARSIEQVPIVIKIKGEKSHRKGDKEHA